MLDKQNINVKLFIISAATFCTLIFSRCLEIDAVKQPEIAAPNDILEVAIDIHSEDTDPNPHAVFFTVLVPNDWEVTGLGYESDKFGNGDFVPSQLWADSCENVHPSGPDYQWLGFLTTQSFLADENRIYATLKCTLKVGSNVGDYFLGYTLGEDALGYDTSYGNVYDYVLNKLIRIVGHIRIPDDFLTIQEGINASQAEMIVEVAPGTYFENLVLKPGIVVDGTEAGKTILNGKSAEVLVKASPNSQIRNFVFRNSGQNRPLIECFKSDSFQIVDNIFDLNIDELAIDVDSSSGIAIENNKIVGTLQNEIGIRSKNSQLTILKNEIDSCYIAIDIENSELEIQRNLILNSNLESIKIYSNSKGSIFNNTLSDHLNGIETQKSLLSVFNNIVVNGSGFGINVDDDVNVSYNDVWNNDGGDYLNCEGGEGALSQDPIFAGGDTCKYKLTGDSPCIDAGDPISTLDPDGTIADLGAFYFHQTGIPSKIRYVYLVHFTHLDIGFTDPQDVVADQYKTIIDKAIEYVDNIPTYKWTVESVWQLEQWMKRSTSEEIQHLHDLVDAGRIDLCAGYATMHSAVLGTEEFSRFLYPAQQQATFFNYNLNTIYQNDVPGYAWAFPSVLANAGIKYFATGINSAFGGGPDLPKNHNPFYWQGPDGKKVLTWISEGSYIEWYTTYQMTNISLFYDALSIELDKYEAAGYPYDAIMIMVGKIENTEPSTLHTGMTSLWNSKYANPKLIVAKPDDFFKHLEENYGEQFETYSGDWSGAWDNISLNVPQSMALNRAAHDRVLQAEKLATVNLILNNENYPSSSFSNIYENMLQFDEHSGGGAPWPGYMTYDETQHQSEIALQYAKDAYDSSEYFIDVGLESLSEQIVTVENSVLVFNPLSWQRTDIVRMPFPQNFSGQNIQLNDATSDEIIDFQKLETTNEIIFTASDVPSFGYKIYHIGTGSSFTNESDSSGQNNTVADNSGDAILENSFFKIQVNPLDGEILSIWDKNNSREWINQSSVYGFNDCIKSIGMSTGNGNYEDVSLGSAQIDSSIQGDVAKAFIITRTGSPVIKTEIWIYDDIPSFDIINTADRDLMDWVPQSVNAEYYAYTFPFDLSAFDVHLEGAHGFWQPNIDQLPGAPRGYFAIQHGGVLSENNFSIHWANRESFVVEFEKFHGLESTFNPQEATLITRFLKKEDEGKFLDGSIGAIIPEPGAGSLLTTSYSFTSNSSDFDAEVAWKFNWSFSNSMSGREIFPNSSGKLNESELSFFQIDQPNVCLVNAKKTEEGESVLLRLLETSGKSTTANISSDVFHWNSAYLTDGLEREISSAGITNNSLEIFLNANEMKSVRADLVKSDIDVSEKGNSIYGYQLFQNYPNPFNPLTHIQFQVPQNSHVKIQIYNVMGQMVRELLNEEVEQGFYSIEWDGKNDAGAAIASGIYLYQIQAGSWNDQRKLLMLK